MFGAGAGAAQRPDLIVADFEMPTYGDWTARGTAFGSSPLRPTEQRRPVAMIGSGLAASGRMGIEAQGEVDMSGVFFPNPDAKTISLKVEGGPVRIRRLVVHELRSIWPECGQPTPGIR